MTTIMKWVISNKTIRFIIIFIQSSYNFTFSWTLFFEQGKTAQDLAVELKHKDIEKILLDVFKHALGFQNNFLNMFV